MKSLRTSLTFGRIAGIPLRVHWNWLVTAVLVTWSLAVGYFPQALPSWEPFANWGLAFLTMLLFFSSVLLHELGHAWIAIREGVPVHNITLFILGGVANIAHEPESPGSEFRIVAAGPLTSLFLAGFFALMSGLFPFSQPLMALTVYLSRINMILAVFNLLPGYPLDGGRLLRSALWRWKRDFLQATRWAVRASEGIALLFLVGGAIFIWQGDFFSGVWVGFIGWYLGAVAHQGKKQAEAEHAVQEVSPPEMDIETDVQRAVELQPLPFTWVQTDGIVQPFEHAELRRNGHSVLKPVDRSVEKVALGSSRKPCPEPCPD